VAVTSRSKAKFRDFMEDSKGGGLDDIIRSTSDDRKNVPDASRQTDRKPAGKTKKSKMELTSQFAIRFYPDQYTFLVGLNRKITNSRKSSIDYERITNSTIIRSFISILKELDIDTTNITSEEVLTERIREALEKHYS